MLVAHKHVQAQGPQVGYLLTCPRTGAWQGPVRAPGSSLSIGLPTPVVWLCFGLRGPGAAGRPRWPGQGGRMMVAMKASRAAARDTPPDPKKLRSAPGLSPEEAAPSGQPG